MIRAISIVVYLFFYLIFSLPYCALVKLIHKVGTPKYNRKMYDYTCIGCTSIVKLSGARVKTYGLENIPKDTPVCFLGNHNSFFDPLIALPLSNYPTGFVVKNGVEKVPLLGGFIGKINCIYLDRNDIRAGLQCILDSAEKIKSGVSIFIYPEGTRSKDGQVHELKGGSFKAATKSGCPIVPVAIKGSSQILEDHFPKVTPADVTISFGKPIFTKQLSKEEIRALPDTVRNDIIHMLEKH